MNIAGITNLNQHIAMSAKKDKVRGGHIISSSIRQSDSYISLTAAKPCQEKIARRLQAIGNKLQSGQRLSSADMEFLREHDPKTYEKAVKIAKEREEYRRALENAKTKEEAQMIHTKKMSMLTAEAKSAQKADEKGGSQGWSILVAWKTAAIINEFTGFIKSDEYSKKPNEHELVERKSENSNNPDNNVEIEKTKEDSDSGSPSSEVKEEQSAKTDRSYDYKYNTQPLQISS